MTIFYHFKLYPNNIYPNYILMNISNYFYIAFLLISSVEPKNSRLAYFRNHHAKRTVINKDFLTHEKTIRNKLCNAATCLKCFDIIANSNRVNQKILVNCKVILTFRSCCPRKLRLNRKF